MNEAVEREYEEQVCAHMEHFLDLVFPKAHRIQQVYLLAEHCGLAGLEKCLLLLCLECVCGPAEVF